MKYKKARVKFSYEGSKAGEYNYHYMYTAYFIPESDTTTLFLSSSDRSRSIKVINQPIDEINIERFLYPDLLEKKTNEKIPYTCDIIEKQFNNETTKLLSELYKTKEATKKALEKYLKLKDKFEVLETQVGKEILE